MNLSGKQSLYFFVKLCKVFCLFLVSHTVSADAILSYKTNTGIVNLQIKNEQIYAQNIDNGTDLLFDKNSNQLTVIQHNKKSISILNEAELIRINQKLSGLQASISANLNPEQHDQLNNFLGGLLGSHQEQAAPAYGLKRTGSAQVGDFICQQAQLLKNQQGIGHLCTVTLAQLNLNSSDFNTLLSLQNFAIKAGDIMSDSLNSLSNNEVPNLSHIQLNEFLIFSKIKKQPDSHFYLQSISTTPIATQFNIPNNYQQKSLLAANSFLR